MEIRLKRVDDDPAPGDGFRVLVDRPWPRGLSKERAALDLWAKEVAPSTGTREVRTSQGLPRAGGWSPCRSPSKTSPSPNACARSPSGRGSHPSGSTSSAA
ncbi:DUF488 domain-containing protein [Microbacterium sp. BE35]|uniref:DUF488 domain-containing protein n=1 Tax=Microbacterium TaxID=33882 RepID=UPI000A07169D